MNPALIHFYSDRNVGDAAILAALSRLAGVRGFDVLGPNDKARAAEASALISVGGDIFNNARPGLVTRRFLSKLSQLRWAPQKTMLFGQSIPPSCDGVALNLLAKHLRRISSVTVRDPQSVEKLSGRGTAVFSIRSFNHMYPTDEADYMRRMVDTMVRLSDAGLSVAVLLQAEVDEADSDRTLCEALRQQFSRLKILDPFQADGEPWRVALGALGEARTVIGTRYHTAIFRMVMGRMPVGLWYSNKGEDLHRRFHVPGSTSDGFNPAVIAPMALRGYRSDSQHVAPVGCRVSKADSVSAAPSLWRNVLWMAGAESAARVTRILAALALAYALSPAVFGAAALVMTIADLMRTPTRNGVLQAIVRADEGALPGTIAAAVRLNWLVHLALAALQCAIAFPLARFMGAPEIAWPLVALSGIFLC